MSEAESAPGAADHDIAVIGMACRFPGGVRTPEELWRLSLAGTDAVTEVPESRWRTADLYAADPERPGMISTKWAGCVEDIDRFDAEFFGIAPREAAQIDPQQRLLLETAYEALETAGAPRHREPLAGGGVFVGISGSDYGRLLGRDLTAVDAHFSTGQAGSIAANRLSYVLGMTGPSLAVDTACSSSLVAVHLAVRSLRAGDCRLALAAGVNLVLAPDQWVSASKAGMMSPTGRCRSFGAEADGFVRSDGCGVLALKPLALAEADGDPVLGVIRGSAVNQDGRSNGLTAPNGPAQEAVIRAALADAGVGPEEVGHIEAHGSGTPLGDPVEIGALAATYGRRSPNSGACVVSSVKSNLGHAEAAAGMAGLIRLLLSLREGQVPATLHTGELNPRLALDGTRLRIAQRTQPWPAAGERRIGSVSSFGFGGTNAHLVVGQADGRAGRETAQAARPATGRRPEAGRRPGPLVLPLSAMGEAPLRALAARYLRQVEAAAGDADRVGDLCYSAAAGRGHRPARVAFSARDPAELREQLGTFASGGPAPHARPASAGARWRDTVLVFSGQGQELIGAGATLLEEPDFAGHAGRCARAFDGPLGVSVLDLLTRDDVEAERQLARTDVAQAVLFTVQSGLARLWSGFGVKPAAVIGHSAGESAAAHAAGLLDFDAATALVLARGGAMQTAGEGRMVAVAAPAETVAPFLEGYGGAVVIAVENAPRGVVVSGPAARVDEVTRALGRAGHRCHPLPGRFAFHSPVMAAAAAELEGSGSGVGAATGTGAVPLFSSVTGTLLDGAQLDTAHWARGLAGRVRFREAVREAARWGFTTFLEIGPRPTLGGAIRASAAQGEAAAQVVHAACPADERLAGPRGVLPELYVRGADLDWQAVHAGGRFLPETPTYPWQRGSHWATGAFLPPPPVPHQDSAAPPAGTGEEPVTSVPVATATGSTGSADSVGSVGSVGSVVRDQLDVMRRQLTLLGQPPHAGAPATAPTPAPEPATPPLPPPAPEPVAERAPAPVLTHRQQAYVDSLVRRVEERSPQSRKLAEQYGAHLVTSRPWSGSRPPLQDLDFPLTLQRARGARFWDADGAEYTDYCLGFGAHFLGHHPPCVEDAVAEQVRRSFSLGPRQELMYRVAEQFCRVTGHDRVSLTRTASEAVTAALRLARRATGRRQVIRFTGSHHELTDGVPGVGAGGAGADGADVVVLPYDDPAALDHIEAHRHDVAAVLVEPVRARDPAPPPGEFLRALRRLTGAAGTVLVLDETVTGFRGGPRGARELSGVEPDLTAYGRVLGGGLDIAALAGSGALLDGLDGGAPHVPPAPFGGAAPPHPLSVAAAGAVLTHLEEHGERLHREVDDRAARLTSALTDLFAARQLPYGVAGFGSLWRFRHEGGAAPHQRLPLETLRLGLLADGLYAGGSGTFFLSTEHTDGDAERFLEAVGGNLDAMRRAGLLPKDSPTTPPPSRPSRPAAPDSPPVRARWPVSAHQRELWELCRRAGPDSLAHNETVVLAFHGPVRTEPLRRALHAVCRRHPALGATFAPDGAHLVDGGGPGPALRCAEARDDASADALIGAFADAPFDLAAGPLFRAMLVRRGADRCDLVLSAHHLVLDGTSTATVLADLSAAYAGAASGADPDPDSDRVRQEVRDPAPQPSAAPAKGEEVPGELVAYWRGRLEGYPAPVWSPGEVAGGVRARPRPPTRRAFHLEGEVWDALVARCPALRCTPFMVAFSAFTAALHGVSGRDDLVVGVPVDQRQGERERDAVGHFVNYVPVRSQNAGTGFLPHHRRTSGELIEDLGHAEVPLRTLLAALEREGAVPDAWAARRELTSVVFDLNPPVPPVVLDGVRGDLVLPPVREAKFDLFFDVIPVGGAVRVDVIHRAHVPAGEVDSVWKRWRELIRRIACDTGTGREGGEGAGGGERAGG